VEFCNGKAFHASRHRYVIYAADMTEALKFIKFYLSNSWGTFRTVTC